MTTLWVLAILILATLPPANALQASEELFCSTTTDTLAGVEELSRKRSLAPRDGVAVAGMSVSNIQEFLDTCPAGDPALPQILSDFTIRRNGTPVSVPACSEPVSSMPIASYSDELIALQGLRVAYYMDRGQFGHLPWTPGDFYDWMRSKVAGIDIRDGAGPSCCSVYDGELYFTVGTANDFNRDFDRTWQGISGNLALYAHEARHVDGFPHVSCCGITFGCDQSFDPQDLSPYGVQWWLNSLWLDGTINVGYGCLTPFEVLDIANWHLGATNGQFRNRFCSNLPPLLDAPVVPGGACEANAFLDSIFADGFESGELSAWSLSLR